MADAGFWLWAKRIGITAGAVVALSSAAGVVGSIAGYAWNRATEPIIERISSETEARATIDSLLFLKIRGMESDVVMLGRAWLSEPGSEQERQARRYFVRRIMVDQEGGER